MSELPHRPLNRIIRASDAASWIDGYAFLERAKTEATAMLADAVGEVARSREAGRIEGREAGEAEAAALLLRTRADIDRYLAAVEPRLADLALDIVRKVLGVFDDAELVAHAARQALENLREETSIVVNVAPEIAGEVEQHLRTLTDLPVRIAPDRHLFGRQCIVTTLSASIDVGLDTQLAAIRETMTTSDRSDA